jgi:hypothetical protein
MKFASTDQHPISQPWQVLVETSVPLLFICSQLFIAGGLIYLCKIFRIIKLAPFRWSLAKRLFMLTLCNIGSLT